MASQVKYVLCDLDTGMYYSGIQRDLQTKAATHTWTRVLSEAEEFSLLESQDFEMRYTLATNQVFLDKDFI